MKKIVLIMLLLSIGLLILFFCGCATLGPLGSLKPGASIDTDIPLNQTVITVVNASDYDLVIYCDGSPATRPSPTAQKEADEKKKVIKGKEEEIKKIKKEVKTIKDKKAKKLKKDEVKTLQKEVKDLEKEVKELKKVQEIYFFKKGESLTLSFRNTSKNYITSNIVVVAYKATIDKDKKTLLTPVGAASRSFGITGYARNSQSWIVSSREVRPYK